MKTYLAARHEIFNETNKADALADLIAFIDASLNS